MEQEVGDDDVEHGVAQEFQAFVGIQLLIGALAVYVGAMRKGGDEKTVVLESVSQDFLQLGKRSFLFLPGEYSAEYSKQHKTDKALSVENSAFHKGLFKKKIRLWS